MEQDSQVTIIGDSSRFVLVETLRLKAEEMRLILIFLDWIRAKQVSEFKAIKSHQDTPFVDVVIADRNRHTI